MVESFSEYTQWNEVEARVNFSFRHFRLEKGTGTKMCPAIVPGYVTGDVPANFFFLVPNESPRRLCEV